MSTASSSSKPSGQWQPPTLEEMQAMLPQYQFVSLLGRGGMGAVYKARQVSLQRSVAIKVLPGDLIDDLEANFAERFKNEARTMAKMNHPGIVKVFDFGETQTGLLYIVMEFIDGTDVSQMIRSKGKLPQDYALAITAHVGDALAYAHKNGVIHRDIKPANILINQEGTVKVADFGLAKANDSNQRGLTKTNTAMGTPDFVAPEALSPGTVVDGRADLYAMGVMLYQMLTGEIPRGMWSMPSTKVGSDPRYDAVILKAMQTDRELRYQDATEIRRDLDVIMTQPMQQEAPKPAANKPSGSQPQSGPRASRSMPQGPAQTPARPAKKKSNDALVYLVAVVVIGGAVGLFMLSGGAKSSKSLSSDAAGNAGRIDRATPPANSLSTRSASSLAGPVNLLALVDAKRDAVRGQWEMQGKELVLKMTQGPQFLAFRHTPPEEYDFEIEFTLKGGIREASQIMPLEGKSILRKMGFGFINPTQFGFGPDLDAVKIEAPTRREAVVKRERLLAGQRYRSLVEVRKGSLRALIDGREVLRWSGDFKRLGGSTDYVMPNPKCLGIAGFGGGIIFHKVEIRAPGSVPVVDTTLSAPAPRASPAVSPASANAAAPTKGVLTNSLGMQFVPVPGTSVLFCIHETRYQDYAAYAAEAQGVNGLWKDQSAGGHTPTQNKEQHPVCRVSYDDAHKFCAWLSQKEGRTYRLPTDREWSIAVGIGDDEQWTNDATPATVFRPPNVFPWGTQWPPPNGSGNYSDQSLRGEVSQVTEKPLEQYDDGFPTTAPVMSFKPNKFGLYDMGGNVPEWVEDWWDDTKTQGTLRGGAWFHSHPKALASSSRQRSIRSMRNYSHCFRVVVDVSKNNP